MQSDSDGQGMFMNWILEKFVNCGKHNYKYNKTTIDTSYLNSCFSIKKTIIRDYYCNKCRGKILLKFIYKEDNIDIMCYFNYFNYFNSILYVAYPFPINIKYMKNKFIIDDCNQNIMKQACL